MMRQCQPIEAFIGGLVLVAAAATATAQPTTPVPTNTTMSPTTNQSTPTPFPDASNTGIPATVTLTAYTGPMIITRAGTVIDAKTIRGTLVVAAQNVTIKRSNLLGNISSDRSGVYVTILDSEIDGGTSSAPAVGYSNITMSRVNVHGSRVSVSCGSNCLIEDSWLHGQFLESGSDWHVNGYITNGGSHVVVRHNTIACEPQNNSNGGGCTGPGASFGDFAPLQDITYDGNLFVAGPGGYCLHAGYNPSKPYGNDPTGIVIKNNVFQRGANHKCGVWGAVTSFKESGSGNVFSNNKWDDGSTVKP
jgi:hypothetical protein